MELSTSNVMCFIFFYFQSIFLDNLFHVRVHLYSVIDFVSGVTWAFYQSGKSGTIR